jgi:deoxyadenosine/deoxycytidine kinase
MHIAIAGNIGSGKTTLTTMLANHFKWEAHYEDVSTNPYINDFYEDMQRWSFQPDSGYSPQQTQCDSGPHHL